MPADPFVVVGGGLAAARAVETLRSEGYDGDLVVVSGEAHRPYERPPLSKDYLRGQSDRDAVFPLAEDWYAEQGVELRTASTVAGLALDEHTLVLADAGRLRYARLLLATGSTPRLLRVPGNDLRGVHYLRTLDDADRLSGALLTASLEGGGAGDRVAVVGDGWIGMEVAASARELGLEVTVLGRGSHPLGHALGPEMAEVYARLHTQRGVRLHRRAVVRALTGVEGQVTGVELADGTHVEAATVVVGIGVTPNVGLADAAGLALRPAAEGGGVAVDGTLRTSHPDVWAAGDIASVPSPHYGRPLRPDHWAHALDTGRHAARTMLGSTEPLDVLPYFYSDQFDLGMEYLGHVDVPGGYDDVVVSGSLEDRQAYAFWLREGLVHAGMGLNVWQRTSEVSELIRSRRPVPREELEAFVGG